MSSNRDPAALVANSPVKGGTLETITYTRKLQPRSPGQKRLRVPPDVDGASAAPLREVEVDHEEDAAQAVLNEASSSSSCFASELTFESESFFAGSKRPKKLIGSVSQQKKGENAVRGLPSEEFRRITRSYAKQKKLRAAEEKGAYGGGRLTSLAIRLDEAGNSKHRNISFVKPETSTGNAFSGLTTSEVSHVSGEFAYGNHNGVAGSRKRTHEAPETSYSSCHESVSEAEGRGFPILSKDSGALEQDDLEHEADLACSEHLSNSEESPEISSCKELTLSDLESDILRKSSGGGFSGHSPLLFESSDESLERSRENSTPSYFSLFLRLGSEFSRSSSPPASSELGDEYAHEFILMRFEDRDDEENYQRFRSRERKQALLHDYDEVHSTETEFGDLIIQQRLVMVNWMVEHANAQQLQCETLFLGVGLMDRFLSRGFFKTEGSLQLLGVACITLAVRLEENQPYNCVSRKSFHVRGNTYSRREVVAMEWLVQEVLNFQCLHLTTFNFLWFYLKAAKADEAVEKLAKYLAVLSLLDHERLSFWPSTVAAGLVILASLATDNDSSCNWVMETHVRTTDDDLSECIQSLEWLVKYAC